MAQSSSTSTDFASPTGKPQGPQNVFGQMVDLSGGMKGAKKGERFKFTGQLKFEKSERGWN